MKIKFQKFHGAGNDFVMVNAAEAKALDSRQISRICSRKKGVGADGLIITGERDGSGLSPFIYFNADGSRADFCGNGLRCAALYCHLNFGGEEFKFKTDAGICPAKILPKRKVMIEAPITSIPVKISIAGKKAFFCGIGVPHAVLLSKDIDKVDVAARGAKIRFSKAFAPGGTNVDFAQILSDGSVGLRTYERGVEEETEACGSGACATALCLVAFGNMKFPVKVRVASGDILEISNPGNQTIGKMRKLDLAGPAELSFRGAIEI